MKLDINVEVYGSNIVFVTTFEELKKLHKDADERNKFITHEVGNMIYVLVTDEWDSMYDHRFVQCVSHELNHAAMCALNHVGVNYDYGNQEALCYMQDYLMGKVFEAINKRKPKRVKRCQKKIG